MSGALILDSEGPAKAVQRDREVHEWLTAARDAGLPVITSAALDQPGRVTIPDVRRRGHYGAHHRPPARDRREGLTTPACPSRTPDFLTDVALSMAGTTARPPRSAAARRTHASTARAKGPEASTLALPDQAH